MRRFESWESSVRQSGVASVQQCGLATLSLCAQVCQEKLIVENNTEE
jgi:hypothetical protein